MPDRKPDAVLFPRGAVRGGNFFERVDAAHKRFMPVLGINIKGFVRAVANGEWHLYTANAEDTLNRSPDSPNGPGPRYEWHDQGDIKVGYLIDPAA